MYNNKKIRKTTIAFTLAEILTVIAILGIIAILVIPPLLKNYNQNCWNRAADIFEKKIEVAIKSMAVNEGLQKYNNTKSFLENGLNKYLKIDKICTMNEIDKCFPKEITTSDEVIQSNTLTTAKEFSLDNWETEPIGVRFNNGIFAILLYNNKNPYYQDYIGDIDTSDVIAGLYDVNAYKSPNKYTNDIKSLNSVLNIEKTPVKLTCDDLVSAGLTNNCYVFNEAGQLYYYATERSYDSCKSYCESNNMHVLTETEISSFCASGFTFTWWHWVDDGKADGSNATAVYGACERIEPYDASRTNFSCACVAN